MVRRTKEDAQATRDSILDAAEQLFVRQGVSRTTLQHIATAAGVTRGAIYWHFEDKAALFNDMLERAILPLESAMTMLDQGETSDPLHDLRESLECVFRLTVQDPHARRVFEIASLKLEFVDEMAAVRERRRQNQAEFVARAASRIRIGIAQGQVRKDAPPDAVALGLWALVDGLLRTWLLDPAAFDLIALGRQIVDTQLDCLRAA